MGVNGNINLPIHRYGADRDASQPYFSNIDLATFLYSLVIFVQLC